MQTATNTFNDGGKRVLLQESEYLKLAKERKAAIDALRFVRVSLGWQHISLEGQNRICDVLDQVDE